MCNVRTTAPSGHAALATTELETDCASGNDVVAGQADLVVRRRVEQYSQPCLCRVSAIDERADRALMMLLAPGHKDRP